MQKIRAFFTFIAAVLALNGWALAGEEPLVHVYQNGSQLNIYPDSGRVTYKTNTSKRELLSNVRINRLYDNTRPADPGAETVNLLRTRKGVVAVTFRAGLVGHLTVMEIDRNFYVFDQTGKFKKIKMANPEMFKVFSAPTIAGEPEVSSFEWSLRLVNENIAVLAITLKESNEKQYYAIGSIDQILPIGSYPSDARISYEPSYNRIFVERGKEQLGDIELKGFAPAAPSKSTALVPVKGNAKTANGKNAASEVNAEAAPETEADLFASVEKAFPDFGKAVKEAPYSFVGSDFEQEELNDLRRARNTRPNNSFVLVGETGSGRTELLKAFIKESMAGKFSEINKNTTYLSVDSLSMGAGSGRLGESETKIKDLIEYAKKKQNVVLVIPNIELLRGKGAHSTSKIDALQELAPYIKSGELTVYATTSAEHYDTAIGGDPSIRVAFNKVDKKPLPLEKLDAAMVTWSKTHKYKPLSEDQRKLVRSLALRYDSIGADSVKVLDLQKLVYAGEKIDFASLDKLTDQDIYNIAARRYGVPKEFFTHEGRVQILEKFDKVMAAKVAGYDDLKNLLREDAEIYISSFTSLSKPFGRRLFFGPKGLGKTYVPEIFIEALGLNPKTHFIRIKLDSSTSISRIKVRVAEAAKKGGVIGVLFDEVEKAPVEVQNGLLDLMDSDVMYVEKNVDSHVSAQQGKPQTVEKVRISNLIFTLATNAGAGSITPESTVAQIVDAMRGDGLSEYVIDRVADMNGFEPPKTKEEFISVIKLQLNLEKLSIEKEKNIQVGIQNEQEFLNAIADQYFHKNASYRAAISDTTRALTLALSRLSQQQEIKAQSKCEITLAKVVSINSSRPTSVKERRIGF